MEIYRDSHNKLLKALEAAVNDYEQRTGNTHGMTLQWVRQARAAIAAAKQLDAEISDPGDGPDDDWYRNKATEDYASDDIEIDPDAIVSRGDSQGAFVAAWVFAYDDEDDPATDSDRANGPGKHGAGF